MMHMLGSGSDTTSCFYSEHQIMFCLCFFTRLASIGCQGYREAPDWAAACEADKVMGQKLIAIPFLQWMMWIVLYAIDDVECFGNMY